MKFFSSDLHHIYHRCKDHGVLFYTVEDRLVYYTLSAVKAKKYGINVYAASLMFTHLHEGVSAPSAESLSKYMGTTDSSFTRLYNKRHNRNGRLFEKELGHSAKYRPKDRLSTIIYIFNNHVAKKLCKSAVDERWSFLAYAFSDHPFSQDLDRKKASKALRKALNLMDRRIEKLKALEYVDLDKILPVLDSTEKEQFIDYVISHYRWIDFSLAIKEFGSLERMRIAIDSSSGNDYDIREEYTASSDVPYARLLDILAEKGLLEELFLLPESSRIDLAIMFKNRYLFSDEHLRKALHCSYTIN